MKNILLRLEQMALRFASEQAYDLWIRLEKRSQELRLKVIYDSVPPINEKALKDELERMFSWN